MLRLLQWLFYGHVHKCHKWKIIKQERVEWEEVFRNGSSGGVCPRYILQCEHCGELRVWDARGGVG